MDPTAFDPEKFPRRLNLGCGFDHRPGHLNVDLHAWHNPDLVSDVTDLRPLPDGYYEYAVAQDILEHLPRLRVRTALREWNRVLKVGGTLELRVPNVLGLMKLLRRWRNRTFDQHERLLQSLFGTQHYNGDFHYIGFTDIFLTGLLERTGFTVDRLAAKDVWLFDCAARKVADAPPPAYLRLPDHEAFLDAVYRDVLGREPDADGRAYYLKMLRDGELREVVLDSLQASDEATFVNKVYRDLLGRDPDPEGRSHVLDRLRKGESRESITNSIKGSDECRRRAGK